MFQSEILCDHGEKLTPLGGPKLAQHLRVPNDMLHQAVPIEECPLALDFPLQISQRGYRLGVAPYFQ
jgi:hypothetical protein